MVSVFKVPVLLRGLWGKVHRLKRETALLINKKKKDKQRACIVLATNMNFMFLPW